MCVRLCVYWERYHLWFTFMVKLLIGPEKGLLLFWGKGYQPSTLLLQYLLFNKRLSSLLLMIFNYIVEEVHKTEVLEEEGVVAILVEVEEIGEEVEGVLLGEEELLVWQEMELIILQVKVDLVLWEELQEVEQEVFSTSKFL